MKRSKGMQLGAMLAAMLLLSMAFVPAVSAVSATPTNDPNKKLNELSKDEQKLVLKAIESSNLLTDTEKKDLTKNLNDIWSGKSTLSPAEQEEVLLKAFSIYINYLKIDQPSEVGAQWIGHGDLTYYSAIGVGVSQTDATTMKNHAADPDGFDGYNRVVYHWYTGAGYQADYWTAKYTTDAINKFNSGDYNGGYTNLSWASHYLEDVGNPYHTTYSYQTNHANYENIVASNWATWDLNRYISNAYTITVTDPAQAARDLAAYSNRRMAELDTAVSNNDVPRIRDLTILLISTTASYEKGLINYGKR